MHEHGVTQDRRLHFMGNKQHGSRILSFECDNNIMDNLQRFVILMYDCQCKDINKAWKNIFTKNTNVKRVVPTFAALKQHVRRAIFQGSFIWYQSPVPNPHIHSPLNWGWKLEEDNCYEPL